MWKNISIASSLYAMVKIFAGVIVIFLAELISKKEYADFSYYYAIITGVSAFLQSGVFESSAAKMDKSGRERVIRIQLSLTIRKLCATALVLLIFSKIIVVIINSSLEIQSFLCSIIIGIAIAAGNISSTVLRLTSENKKALLALLLTTVTTSIGYCFGAIIYGTSEAALKASAFAGSIVLMYIYIDGRPKYDKFDCNFDGKQKINIIRDYQIVSFFGWMSGYGINLILHKLASSSVVADFFLLYTLTAALTMLATSINTAWTPVFIKMSLANQNNAHKSNRNITRFLLWCISIFSLGIVGIAPVLLNILGGSNLIQVAQNTHFLSLCLATIIICIPWWEIQNYYIRDGVSQKYRGYVISSSILGLLSWILLVLLFDEYGVYFGFFVMNIIKTSFFVFCSKKNSYYASTYWPATILSATLIVFGFHIKG